MANDKRTEINGWSPEEVVKDWFDKKYLNSSHASRDANELGGSIVLDEAVVVDKLPKF